MSDQPIKKTQFQKAIEVMENADEQQKINIELKKDNAILFKSITKQIAENGKFVAVIREILKEAEKGEYIKTSWLVGKIREVLSDLLFSQD
ncbi:TPA: hypothetical protein DCQ22_03965 [Candidatus Nomurabacteria bacterium]|nr:hypothetical protein [Candidatus Nomurabacteria bacterium]